ncbi:phosphoribosylanthranilate isomerase [uncultured Methanobrevibacter sp.]|uniref:phosphoribosylanthranilate isomerase n=1 Tax=uncultured Methanobrevibacter sp. TaxID=253161 RepID=UPI00260329B6
MVKLKICGLRREEDIDMVNRYSPDFIGFVFAESPRKVTKEEASHLSSLLNDEISPVGVFVNEEIDFILDLFKENIIGIAQLHGDEDEEYIKKLKALSKEETGREIPVINAVEIRDDFDDSIGEDERISSVRNKLIELSASASDYLLLDSGKGSGKTFNWTLIEGVDEIFKKPYFLAGGLNSNNLKLAMEEFNPFAVDLSSGVEINGFKDESLIGEVSEILREFND